MIVDQNQVEFIKRLDYLEKQLVFKHASNPPLQNFTEKFAIIYDIKQYSQLKKIDEDFCQFKMVRDRFRELVSCS